MDTSKQKPDLMSSKRAAADGGKRILAHLEHGPKTAAKPPRASGWTIDGWTVGLGLLLITMCTVAWLIHDNTLSTATYSRGHSTVSTRMEPPPAERQTPAPTEQAAAIVNEPAAKEPGAKSDAPSETHAAASVSPPSAHATPALARIETTRTTGAAHKPVAAASPAAARTPVPRTATAAAPPAAGDTDVALLAALVAHSGKPTLVLPERSRDVVERQEGDSTTQLLARCKQLGLIEGMLCRSRICSGRWDADPACNAPSH